MKNTETIITRHERLIERERELRVAVETYAREASAYRWQEVQTAALAYGRSVNRNLKGKP